MLAYPDVPYTMSRYFRPGVIYAMALIGGIGSESQFGGIFAGWSSIEKVDAC